MFTVDIRDASGFEDEIQSFVDSKITDSERANEDSLFEAADKAVTEWLEKNAPNATHINPSINISAPARTSERPFSGKNYSIEYVEDQFVLSHPVSEDETFDSFEELVESHPVCEEAREFFFGD